MHDGLVDEAYVRERTVGWDEVRRTVEPFTPEYAEKLCGVPAERILAAARLYGQASPSLVTPTIRPDTLFVPFHYGHEQAVNQLTNAAAEPSEIPEFKACAAALERAGAPEAPRAEPVRNFDARRAPDMFPYASGEGRSTEEEESKKF